jgi:hypothetical protein
VWGIFTDIFQLLVEQLNLYYQQHWKQAGASHLSLPDIMMFRALALWMGHDVTEKLQDSWSRLE